MANGITISLIFQLFQATLKQPAPHGSIDFLSSYLVAYVPSNFSFYLDLKGSIKVKKEDGSISYLWQNKGASLMTYTSLFTEVSTYIESQNQVEAMQAFCNSIISHDVGVELPTLSTHIGESYTHGQSFYPGRRFGHSLRFQNLEI